MPYIFHIFASMIMVTGATGFIGSAICETLLERGYRVLACKRASSKIPKRLHKYQDQIRWCDLDLLDFFAVSELLSSVQALIHCAAQISFDPVDKSQMWRNNVDSTRNLVNAVLEFPDVHFCMISSIAAVGEAKPGQLIDENCRWMYHSSKSDYAITKFESEREVWRGFTEGMHGFIVNPSIVLGYDERGGQASEIINQLRKGLRYYPDGVCGFVDVRDVAQCTVELLQKKVHAERFILSAENCSYQELFSYFAEGLGIKAPDRRISKRSLTFVSWILRLAAVIRGVRPALNKYSINSAYNKMYYNNQKICQAIDYRFMSVRESVLRMIKENQ